MLQNSFQQLNGSRAIHAKCNKLLYLTEFVITIFRTPQFVKQEQVQKNVFRFYSNSIALKFDGLAPHSAN